MITRNDIYNWVKSEYNQLSKEDLGKFFVSLTDEILADTYNLNIIRKGYFTRK